jgi:hypothetical protein
VCALPAAKNQVNVFLYDGAIVPDLDGIMRSGRREFDLSAGTPTELHALSLAHTPRSRRRSRLFDPNSDFF